MSRARFNRGLLKFLQQSPTPFHAVTGLSTMLDMAGFERLHESEAWRLKKNGRFYVVRNDSAIVAFKTGSTNLVNEGIRLAGAHTDSPCLKVKPDPVVNCQGYVQLGVEVYGGALLQPWFDRDLSMAGRVNFQTDDGKLGSALVDFEDPVAYIPSLAIHLDRMVNEGRPINAQKELPPILMQRQGKGEVKTTVKAGMPGAGFNFEDLLLKKVKDTGAGKNAKIILAHELFLYDTQPPALVGLEKEFIASARLDNLLSCYLSCQALIDSDDSYASVMVCNDHEEVGSASTSGAQGPFLRKVLQRWIAGTEKTADAMERVLASSVLFSIDNAHGVHPNYLDKHDDQHRPLLNGGPVIKINANQRYASNSESIALFKALCHELGFPYQSFVMRSDMACGSTIGPITATELGITTLDIGVPQFAMHSIRELAGSADAVRLMEIVKAFYNR